MKTTIIVKKRGEGYIATVHTHPVVATITGARIGVTPYDAATRASELMLRYAAPNVEGGVLMAPPEVLDLVPQHLRRIDPAGALVQP